MAITYNGISLGYTATQSVQQSNQLDPSGADRLYTTFLFRVNAVLAPNVIPAEVGENPTDTAKRIEHLLMTPRCHFTYTGADGVVYLDVDGRDDGLGPVPKSCNVSSLHGGSWLVAYEIEVRISTCDGIPPWLSLRWAESVSFDQQWRCTRVRSGYLILSGRSDSAPDSWRSLVSPAVPSGFRRERADYTLTEDGLTIKFHFEDRQLVCPPPFPAVKCSGAMVESLPVPGGLRRGQITLRLDGPPGVDTKELLNAAVRIGVSRAMAAGVVTTRDNRFIMGGSVEEGLGDADNYVALTLQWQMKPAEGREKGRTDGGQRTESRAEPPNTGIAGFLPGISELLSAAGQNPGVEPVLDAKGHDKAALPLNYASWVGAPLPGCDPDRGIAPPTAGVAAHVKLVAAALRDPCGTTSELRAGTATNELVATDPEGTLSLTATIVSEIPPDDLDAQYFSDSTPGAYDTYRIVSHYRYDPGTAVLASTKSGEAGAKVRMHNAKTTLRVEWVATRIGGPPVTPDPNPTDTNCVFVGGTVSPTNDDLAADGVSVIYTVSGVFDYEFLDSAKVGLFDPTPPYFTNELRNDPDRRAFALIDTSIVFGAKGQLSNPFTGLGVTRVGGQTSELRGGPRADG